MVDKTNKLSGVDNSLVAALVMSGLTEHEYCQDAFIFSNYMLSNKDYPDRIHSIAVCDGANIRGYNLVKLFGCGCLADVDTFIRVIDLIENEVISSEEIFDNLSLDEPIPFLDEKLALDYQKSIKRNNSDLKEWEEYASKQKESFSKRLNEKKREKQYQKKKGNK